MNNKNQQNPTQKSFQKLDKKKKNKLFSKLIDKVDDEHIKAYLNNFIKNDSIEDFFNSITNPPDFLNDVDTFSNNFLIELFHENVITTDEKLYATKNFIKGDPILSLEDSRIKFLNDSYQIITCKTKGKYEELLNSKYNNHLLKKINDNYYLHIETTPANLKKDIYTIDLPNLKISGKIYRANNNISAGTLLTLHGYTKLLMYSIE